MEIWRKIDAIRRAEAHDSQIIGCTGKVKTLLGQCFDLPNGQIAHQPESLWTGILW